MGLFGGGTTIHVPPNPTLTSAAVDESERQARRLTDASPEELAMLRKLGVSADQADQAMVDQIRQLGVRGEDLANVDAAYMERAYRPAFDRLMNDYELQNQAILESMNARGVTGGPGARSEPEMYQQMLLQRSTQQTLADTMMNAQNQAVQQKLAQYNARLAEPQVAATRFGQTATPLQQATLTPAEARLGARTGAASNIYNAKLGLAGKQLESATGLKQQQMQNQMNLIGGGLGVLSGSLGILSDPNMKKDIEPGTEPDEALNEVRNIPVDRWRYRWEDDSQPQHEGAMATDVPMDVQIGDGEGIDVPSYLGKLTSAIQALDRKMGAFDRLMMKGGVEGGL